MVLFALPSQHYWNDAVYKEMFAFVINLRFVSPVAIFIRMLYIYLQKLLNFSPDIHGEAGCTCSNAKTRYEVTIELKAYSRHLWVWVVLFHSL